MCGGGDGRHVVHGAGAVVHVREHQHRDLGRECRRKGVDAVDELQREAAIAAQRLGDVQVGRKVAALAHHGAARRVAAVERLAHGSEQHLVEIDRGAVGAHHLVGRGADQARELVAQALRQVDPTGGVPRADQAGAPFLRHHLGDACGGGRGHDAQRIAVEVDHALGQREQGAQVKQWVGAVEGAAVVEGHGQGGHRGSSRSTARTGEASALTSLSGSAISS
jgi:hypothetical protein